MSQMNPSLSVLLIEDNEGHSYLIQEKFRDAFPEAEICRAKTLSEAVDLLPSKSWDLVVVSSKLPDGNAMDFLDSLSARQPFAAVAVLTDDSGAMELELSGHHGAIEIMTKERSTLESFTNRVKRLMATNRRMNALLQEKEGAAENALFRDALTGVYNRAYFEESLRREVWRTNRHRQDLSLLIADIDGFQNFIKKHGPEKSERCLKKLSQVLTQSVRSGDIVARYGNDQFAMLLHQCRKSNAVRCARRVLDTIRKQTGPLRFSVSIGVMHYQGTPKVFRPHQLVLHATRALSQAKSQGGARLHVAA